MAFNTTTILISIAISLGLCIGVIFLQIYLSRRDSKWFGLIIPMITFLFSLFTISMMVAPLDGISINFIMQTLFALLLANIPTFVLLGIYFVCRENIQRKKQLDKMNIQDLD